MKKFNYIFYLIFVLVLSGSCTKEILDKKPLDIISDAQVWNDPALTKAYVINLYSRVPLQGIYKDWDWGKYYTSPTEEISSCDEARNTWDWSSSASHWNKGFLRGDGGFLEYWDYSLIRACNEFLVRIESGKVSDDEKKLYIAEVRFLRAYVYFELVKRYGGVPLITKAQQPNDGDALYVSRNKLQEVYDFIAKECDDVALVLPQTYSSDGLGRATKYAAFSLKSRAMLYAASEAKYASMQLNGVVGIPSTDANKYWQASYDASIQIIQSGKFQLYNKYPGDKAKNYQMIFLDKNNTETIFAKKFISVIAGHGIDFFCAPDSYKGGWGNMVNPTMEFVNSYEMVDGSSGVIDWATKTGDVRQILKNKDPRFHASIFYNGQPWQGDTVRLVWGTRTGGVVTEAPLKDAKGGDATKTGFIMKKFLDEKRIRASSTNESDQDWLVYRYAETLLNYAEAAFELGKTSDALTAINAVRDRAGVAKLNNISLAQIRHERQIELAFETQRYWDLRRWRIAQSVLTNDFHAVFPYYDTNLKTYYFRVANCDGYTRLFKPEHYYFPITEIRRNNNPNLVENPGYN